MDQMRLLVLNKLSSLLAVSVLNVADARCSALSISRLLRMQPFTASLASQLVTETEQPRIPYCTIWWLDRLGFIMIRQGPFPRRSNMRGAGTGKRCLELQYVEAIFGRLDSDVRCYDRRAEDLCTGNLILRHFLVHFWLLD